MTGELVKVPDLLRAWPWERHLNKNYDAAKAASLKWFTSFKAFDDKSQDAFDRCDFGTDAGSCALLRMVLMIDFQPDLRCCHIDTAI